MCVPCPETEYLLLIFPRVFLRIFNTNRDVLLHQVEPPSLLLRLSQLLPQVPRVVRNQSIFLKLLLKLELAAEEVPLVGLALAHLQQELLRRRQVLEPVLEPVVLVIWTG